jgi:hypothetical protein
MPDINSITLAAAGLTDSATDEVYQVVDRRDGATTFRYSGTNPIKLASRILVVVKQPTAAGKYARVTVSFVKPESYIDSDTSLVGQQLVNRGSFEFQIDKNSNSTQILSFTERALLILSDPDIQQAINNVENFY